MKKSLLLIPLLVVGSFAIADEFPTFPMTLQWTIKVWETDIPTGSELKVYSSDTELASYTITEAWKYGSNSISQPALVLNKFDWNLTFKITNNWSNFLLDSIDDSNKWEGCPSADAITFVGKNCVYDLSVAEETFAITFNDSDVPTQNLTYWSHITRPEDPTRAWYIFENWYADSWFVDFFDFENTTITWAINIYARWNQKIDSEWATSTEEFEAIVVDNDVPASWEEETDSKDNKVNWSEVASSDHTATIEWWVDVYPVDEDWNRIDAWVNFSKSVGIKIHIPNWWNWPNWKDYMIKVKHTLDTKYWYAWLTTTQWVTCNADWTVPAQYQYTWGVLNPVKEGNQYYITIYTCSASTFVAYAEKANPKPDTWWGNGGWGWWGGGWGGWSSDTKTYTITWKNFDWTILLTGEVKEWATPKYRWATPTKTWDDQYTYVFSGWNPALWEVSKNTTYTAVFKQISNEDIKALEEAKKAEDILIDPLNPKDTSRYEEWNQSEILSNGYSREFNNAYKFALRNGITTMDTIDKANMNWELNRIAMAKMLSQYAINILWKKPDTTKQCNFWDVGSSLDGQYNNGVTLACQLWIMWVWITDFRPYDGVVRAEFGTALSRMLYGLADWEPYFTTHLTKLKSEWIISNDNPNLSEVRWYVMLMLMRSAK